MAAARLWSGAFLRRRAGAVLALVLLIGLGAGFSLTAAGGARRTASGWERFRAATLAPHAVISLPPTAPAGTFERVAQLPSVEVLAPFTFAPVAPEGLRADVDVTSLLGLSDAFATSVYRPRIIAGRRPLTGRADEVTVNQALADRAGLRLGQQVPLVSGFDPAQLAKLGPVTVVGVHLGSFDVGPNAGGGTLLLPAEFFRAHRTVLEGGPPAAIARLRGGDGAIPRFTEEVAALVGGDAFVTAGREDGAAVAEALRVQSVALWLLTAVAGIATMAAGSQALGRVLASSAGDRDVLAGLGLPPRARHLLGLVPAAVVAGGAAVIAGIVAMVASPLLPTGLARRVEPDPGLFVDPLTLPLGSGVVLVGLASAGLVHGWREAHVARRRAARRRSGPLTGPVTLGIGAGWVLAPSRGPAAVAARSAIVAVAAGLAGVVAVATFDTSLDHLFATERLYGWSFDGALVTSDGTGDGFDEVVAGLTDDPAVTALAQGDVVRLSVGGRTVEALAIDPVRGRGHPSLVAGRAPVGDDEIALGSENLKQLGTDLGDAVPVDGPGRTRTLRVVGVAAFPELGDDSDLANGALVTRAAADDLGLERSGRVALVGVDGGTDVVEVLSRHSRPNVEPVLPFEPARVANMHEIGAIPALLGGFLAVLAAAAVGHALAVSVRAHRHDIGVLRALGLVRSQVCEVVASQALVTVAVGLVVGVPLGFAVGRWSFTLIARELGVIERPVVSWSASVATVASALLVAGFVAALPARAAARLQTASILRSE